MVKKFTILLLSLCSLFLIAPSKISASSDYVIESFDSVIEIEKNTDVIVEETIRVKFLANKHGIYRFIPTLHTSGGKSIKTGIKILEVTDEDNKPYKYELDTSASDIRIKIGDPGLLVTGGRTYVIRYKVFNLLRSFDSHEEFYWNVTGHEWDTDIIEASAEIKSSYADIGKVDCFAGFFGTQDKLCEYSATKKEVSFIATESLGVNKDFTVVVALNKDNSFAYPGFLRKSTWFLQANWGYVFAVLPLLLIYYFWNKKGRDRRFLSDNIYYKPDKVEVGTVSLFSRKNIPLVYHPLDGLSPSEVGTIIDEKVQIQDVVSEIVELARLGFLKIVQLEKKGLLKNKKEYLFEKTKKTDDKEAVVKLKDYQKLLLEEMFNKKYIDDAKETSKEFDKTKLPKSEYVFLSDFKNSFYKKLDEFKELLYDRMEKEGFFDGNPEKARIKWIVLYSLTIAISGALVFIYTTTSYNFMPLVLAGLLGIIGFIFAFSMPRRLPKGYSLYRQIEGLKWYLGKGKWRYEHMEKNLFFEEILPLAIALKVVDKLANEMEELGIKPPSYFGGSSIGSFGSDFNSFYAASALGVASSPSSSGGSSWSGGSGFSGSGGGGGFGGGGGGSW